MQAALLQFGFWVLQNETLSSRDMSDSWANECRLVPCSRQKYKHVWTCAFSRDVTVFPNTLLNVNQKGKL